ncbi:hypothetical protein ACH5RR_005457 [Cinchona calisaya]|uniref:Uncharacterized protein n=1 Tax=Cinchona calisaya TaxID=153742 RepID=A0ABD3ALG7_9GENT
MDKHFQTSEEECVNDTRQYRCLRKYNIIVNQFDELMDMVDAVKQSRKRQRVSNSQRKKSTSGAAGATHSAPTTGEAVSTTVEGGEAKSSSVSSASQEDKTVALEQIITKHLTDLECYQLLELDSQNPDH